MELEGNLILDRPPRRRWVSVVAVVIPVAVFVLAAAWFIRAYVAPPMASITPPMTIAAAPTPDAQRPEPMKPASVKTQTFMTAAKPAPAPATVAAAPIEAAKDQARVSVGARTAPAHAAARPTEHPRPVPVFASLAAAPPVGSLDDKQPAAFADPTPDIAARTADPVSPPATDAAALSPASVSAPTLEPGTPIAGPIPMPPSRPRITVALVTGPVPLPRPRPTDASANPQASEAPSYIDMHGPQ